MMPAMMGPRMPARMTLAARYWDSQRRAKKEMRIRRSMTVVDVRFCMGGRRRRGLTVWLVVL